MKFLSHYLWSQIQTTNCPWILDVTDISSFEANQTRFQNTATQTEDKPFQDVTETI